MTFLNTNLNKPKLNGIKKPTIKMPKLEPKKEIVKPTEPEKVEEVKEEVKEENKFEEITFVASEPIEETPTEKAEEESKEETVDEPKDEIAEEKQQSFDDFKTLDETEAKEKVEENTEEVVTKLEEAKEETATEEVKNEESVVEEEKPKKKATRKRAKAKKEEETATVETEMGSNDLDFITNNLSEIINPTNAAWEEEKVIVNSKMDEIMIDSDMTSADMDEMLAKLSHLENDVRQRLDEISPVYFNLKDLIDYVEDTAGVGSTATERKANGKVICTRYVKEPGATPLNLYTLFNFNRARYEFYKSKMEQIKNENGRLITLSAVKKIECSLSR